MVNKGMTKRILYTIAILLAMSSFEALAIRPAQTSEAKKLRFLLSDYALIPLKDAKTLWQWGTRKITFKKITPELQNDAHKAMLRTGLPVVVITGIVLTACSTIWYKMRRNKAASQDKAKNDEQKKKTDDLVAQDEAKKNEAENDRIAREKEQLTKIEADRIAANLKDEWGKTPLDNAINDKDVNAVKDLIAKGANVNQKDNWSDSTLLYWAVFKQASPYPDKAAADQEIVQALIDAKADVNAKNKDNQTPLHAAAHFDRADLIKILVKAGADINAQNKEGLTPLHKSLSFNDNDAALALLEANANPNLKNNDGQTPLHMAVTRDPIYAKDYLAVIQPLLNAGANPNIQDEKGNTPAHYAAYRNNEELKNLLASRSLDSSIKNNKGETVASIEQAVLQRQKEAEQKQLQAEQKWKQDAQQRINKRNEENRLKREQEELRKKKELAERQAQLEAEEQKRKDEANAFVEGLVAEEQKRKKEAKAFVEGLAKNKEQRKLQEQEEEEAENSRKRLQELETKQSKINTEAREQLNRLRQQQREEAEQEAKAREEARRERMRIEEQKMLQRAEQDRIAREKAEKEATAKQLEELKRREKERQEKYEQQQKENLKKEEERLLQYKKQRNLVSLQDAIYSMDVDAVKRSIADGADINEINSERINRLIFQANKQNENEIKEILEIFIDAGYKDINRKSFVDYKTPLKVAIETKNAALVNLLLDKGVDVNVGDPINDALDNFDTDYDLIKKFIDKGALVNNINTGTLFGMRTSSDPARKKIGLYLDGLRKK